MEINTDENAPDFNLTASCSEACCYTCTDTIHDDSRHSEQIFVKNKN